MDNAKYHKRVEGLPRCLSALRKDELKTRLLSKGAKIEQIENRKELYELARDNPAYKGTPSWRQSLQDMDFALNVLHTIQH